MQRFRRTLHVSGLESFGGGRPHTAAPQTLALPHRRWMPPPGFKARRGSGLGTVSVENAHNTGLADGPLLCAHGIKRQEQQVFRGASDDRIA